MTFCLMVLVEAIRQSFEDWTANFLKNVSVDFSLYLGETGLR